MNAKKTNTPEEIRETYTHYCTVGQLKEILKKNNIPDDAKIFIQRVEDVYFEKHGWGTVKKQGDMYLTEKRMIDKARPGGEFHDKEQYPDMDEETIQNILESEKSLDDCLEEYVPAWYPCVFKGDDNIYFCAFY